MKIGICEWNIPNSETARRFEWVAEAGLTEIKIDLGNAYGKMATQPSSSVRQISQQRFG